MIAPQFRFTCLAGLALGLAAVPGCSVSESGASAQDTQAIAPQPLLETAAALPDQAPGTRQRGLSFAGELTQGGFIRGMVPRGTVAARIAGQSLQIAPDGSFFAAFDRDAPATLSLTARLADGGELAEPLTVAPRDWQISRVNIPLRSGGSSEAWWARRKPELDAIKAARAKATGATGWQQDFIWPVKGRISGLFGRQRIYQGTPGSYHSGIDIAPGSGVPFVAPADGVVVLARTGFSLEGGLIIIDHGAGLNSAFLHASQIAVEEGQRVAQGQHIGNVGASGRATGPHLHWSLKWNDARLDPLLFTGPMN